MRAEADENENKTVQEYLEQSLFHGRMLNEAVLDELKEANKYPY